MAQSVPASLDPAFPLQVAEFEDTLLGCLEIVAAHYDRSIAPAAFTAGLPLPEGRLNPGLFPRAAARAGLSARVVKRPVRKILRVLFPVILLLRDNQAVVLAGIEGETALVVLPQTGRGAAKVPLRAIEEAYTGYAILVKPEYRPARGEEPLKESAGHWFWSALAPLWPAYLQVFLAAALINMLVIAAPLFIMNVYDRVLPNKAISTLWVLALGMGAVVIFDFVLKTVRHALLGNAGRRADVLLASRIFAHVLSLDLSKRPLKTGEFANQLRDYEMVREFFTSSTVVTLTDFIFVWLFILIIAYIAGPVALIPAIAVVLVVGAGIAIQLPLQRVVNKAQAEATHRHSLLIEALNGLETIKCARAEGQFQRTWEQFVGHNSRTTEQMRSLSTLAMNFTGFVQQLVTVGVVLIGVYVFADGQVSSGAIIAAVILASRAVAPLGQIAGTISRSQQALHAFKVLNKIMEVPAEHSEQERHINRKIGHGKFTFDNVTFTYPDAPAPALKDFTLRVEPGERVGIIGKVGSGKTTIGRLLSRLYVPSSGSLLVDDVDIHQYHPAEIRRCVAFVSQDSTLFYGTLRDNIVLGAPNVSDDLVLRAAELAGVTDFVKGHPQGFNMQVGEGGRYLSSGQRQMVILARALLLEPGIIFLDEPTGAMDLASERQLVQRLKLAFQPHQTIVITTHRMSVLTLIDRLVVIDQGRVLADGPRDQILDMLNRTAVQAGMTRMASAASDIFQSEAEPFRAGRAESKEGAKLRPVDG